jgi:hypothetical protein
VIDISVTELYRLGVIIPGEVALRIEPGTSGIQSGTANKLEERRKEIHTVVDLYFTHRR